MFNILLRKTSMIEMLPPSDTFPVIEHAQVSPIVNDPVVSNQKVTTIERCIKQAMNLPMGTEDTISICGFLTEFTLDRHNSVHGICPHCKRRQTLYDAAPTCPPESCSDKKAALNEWRPAYAVSLAVSDHSGTWQHLYLSDTLCNELISVSVSCSQCE